MGEGASVFCGTPLTWKDRGRRDDQEETKEAAYRVREWYPVVFCGAWLIVPRYRNR